MWVFVAVVVAVGCLLVYVVETMDSDMEGY